MFLVALLATIIRTGPEVAAHDVFAASIDRSADPAVDFFQYADGAWLKANPIPPSESGWGIGNLVDEENYRRLRTVSERAAKLKAKTGSDDQKVGDFWATAMDTHLANRRGLADLRSELTHIEGIRTTAQCLHEAFRLQRLGVEALWSFSVGQDERNSSAMVAQLYQGGLGLGRREFYFQAGEAYETIRREYRMYLGSLLRLAGQSNAQERAAKIVSFETALARSSRTLADVRDPVANYHKLSIAELVALAPGPKWETEFRAWGIQPKIVVVGQPEFMKEATKLVAKTDVGILRDYLACHLLAQYAPYLSAGFEQASFHFRNQVLAGQKEPRPRWKRALDAENQALGFVLGRVYVHQCIPPTFKDRYSRLVEAFRTSLHDRILRLDWMTDATKQKALAKLAKLNKKVAYPDKWKDYSKLSIGRVSFCANMMAANRWGFDDMVSKFGKPVDRTEWGMTPQTCNAYYSAELNEIVLPAAVFAIPGYTDTDLDDAILYGFAGASTIGHEMTHGFDDDGRQYDGDGNLRNWWTAEDEAKFKVRAKVLVDEFNAFEPLPGLHINGEANLGENLADLGGLVIGLDAFKKTREYQEGKSIAGFTPLQRFFLAYAYSWTWQQRDESLRTELLSDFHSPPKWRVLGPLSNLPDFYDAFGVKPGQPMWRAPEARASIW